MTFYTPDISSGPPGAFPSVQIVPTEHVPGELMDVYISPVWLGPTPSEGAYVDGSWLAFTTVHLYCASPLIFPLPPLPLPLSPPPSLSPSLPILSPPVLPPLHSCSI